MAKYEILYIIRPNIEEEAKNAFTYIDTLGQYGTVVTADADGQHNVWDIFRVSKKAQENPNHLILGVRSFSGKVPLRSAFGNKVTRFLFQRQTGVSVTDTQTGLRGFTTNMIPFFEKHRNMLLFYAIQQIKGKGKR